MRCKWRIILVWHLPVQVKDVDAEAETRQGKHHTPRVSFNVSCVDARTGV